MKVRLLRHATLLVEIGQYRLLVDPMLSQKDAMPPVQNAANSVNIPMVAMPISNEELQSLIQETDAVLVTHTHRDHWDAAAQAMIPKDFLIIGQPEDEAKFKEQGFKNVQAVAQAFDWQDIKIYRTGGQHGTGEIGQRMAPVSGFVLEYKKQRLYIAGDTIWCEEVQEALDKFQPKQIVLNGGAAQFLQGDPITMTTDDIQKVANYAPLASIVVVHLDTVNHCLQTRPIVHKAFDHTAIQRRIHIPNDGEWVRF